LLCSVDVAILLVGSFNFKEKARLENSISRR
jgi:hypothetical protein